MYLNLKDSETQKVYVTTDTHFNHDPKWEVPIWKMRGYNSAKDHTDGILNIINETVSKNDILLHLGDFCLNTNPSQFEELISKINCQNVYMLWGNHPNSHFKNVYKPLVRKILGELYTENSEVYPVRYKNIVYYGHYVELVWNGQFIVLEHYPLLVWNEMMHGAWMLCGHSHYGCPQTVASNPNGKILDVGWDGHKKPLTFEEVSAIMSTKQFVVVDDHHK